MLSFWGMWSFMPFTPVHSIETLETAIPLALKNNLDIQKREQFTEIDFGEWTGKSFEELEKDPGWKQFHFYRNGCFIPSGEQMVGVQARMVGEVERLRRSSPGRNIAIVSHNDPIKSLIAHFLGISLDLFLRITISTGSVSAVSVSQDSSFVHFVNMTGKIPLQVI